MPDNVEPEPAEPSYRKLVEFILVDKFGTKHKKICNCVNLGENFFTEQFQTQGYIVLSTKPLS